MAFATKYTSKVGELLRLATPVVLAQLGYIAVQVADSAMVGAYGGEDAVPLAAVAFGSTIAWVFTFLCMGLSIGLTPIIGELFVQGEKQRMANYLETSLLFYPVFGVMCMALQIATEPLLYHLGQPVEVVDMALPYYRLMAYCLPFAMYYGSFKQFLEGVGNTKAAMIVTIATNIRAYGSVWCRPFDTYLSNLESNLAWRILCMCKAIPRIYLAIFAQGKISQKYTLSA